MKGHITCPYCKDPLPSFNELITDGLPLALSSVIWDHLILKCVYSDSCDCDFEGQSKEFEKHISSCECRFGKVARTVKEVVLKKAAEEKTPVRELQKDSYIKIKRHLNDMITATNSSIDILKEDRLDCKYYILIQELKERGKRSEVKAIDNIWRHGITELTVDECLALKLS